MLQSAKEDRRNMDGKNNIKKYLVKVGFFSKYFTCIKHDFLKLVIERSGQKLILNFLKDNPIIQKFRVFGHYCN